MPTPRRYRFKVLRETSRLQDQLLVPGLVEIELRILKIFEKEEENSFLGFHRVIGPQQTASFTVLLQHGLRDSNSEAKRIISLNLLSLGVPLCNQNPMVQWIISEALALHNTNARQPIVLGIVELRILQRAGYEYDEGEEAIARATRESREEYEEIFKTVPATKSSIEALEKVRVDGVNATEECVICMEKMLQAGKEVRRMLCMHVYHGDCIVEWLQSSHLCPLCRFAMPY